MCCQPIVSSERKPFSQARRIGVLISALALLLGAGCSSGGSDSGEVVSPPPPPPAPTSAAVTFVVVDETGSPIEGSTVDVVGSALSGITDTSGQTTMTIPYTDRLLLSASADGYSDKLQAANVPNGASAHDVVVMLIRRSPAVTIPNIEGGGTATGPDGVTITFPPGALVDSTGQPVVGDVQMFMTPVDVTGPDVAAFPGLFFGVDSNGSDQLLLSHGVAEFVVQQGSETLNIASGQTATVEVPLYADGNADGSAVMVGDLIPFWSLNEATGVWLEEALGEVVASNDSPTGLAVVATVSHFSWWNIDVPSLFHTLNLTVVGPTACIPAGSRATISAEVAQSARTPGTPIPPVSRASVSLYVPTQLCADGVTRTLSVPANLNILVDVVVRVGTTHYSGSTTVGGPAGETSDTTLVLMAMTDPQPSITTPANGSIIQAGNRVAILVEVGGPAPDRVEIYAGSTLLDDVDAAQPFYRVDWETTNESPGEVSISAVATLNGTGYPATPVGIEIEPAPAMPVITTNVQDVTVLEGENATFTVSASGGYLQYGWQQSVDGGATFFPVGFNQPNVTFNAVPAWADGQRVRVAVSNSVGSVSSRVALLTVNSLPQVIVVPASAGAVAGQNVTFTAQASGTAPLSYQWQRSDNNGTTWAAIAAATNSSYTFATSLADDGALFRAQVNNPFGGATSNSAALAVSPAPEPPVITQQPQGMTLDAGQTATFTVAATGTAPLAYQWQRFDVTANAFVNIAGATSATYALVVGVDENGARFRAVVSNAVSTAISQEAALTVNFFVAPEGKRVAAASNTIVRRSDGTVWVWGSIPGATIATWIEQTTPLQVQPFDDARSVAAGGNFQHPFFYVLRQDGSVWAWGSNSSGQLGDGTQTHRQEPQPIPGLTRVIAIANTEYTGFALREDGTVWSWGNGYYGTLGNGTTQDQLTPQQIPGLGGIVAISADSSQNHYNITVVVRNDGVLLGWGPGSNTSAGEYVWPSDEGWRLSPLPIPEAGTVVSAVAGAQSVIVTVGAERSALAWGDNVNGKLGIGAYSPAYAPTPVAGGFAPWNGFRSCRSFSVGWTEAGVGYAWGQNWNGSLGDPGVSSRTDTPNPVPGMTDVVEMACGGENHAVALKSNGEVWAWGYNNRGQVGDGTDTTRLSPVLVDGLNLNTGL